MAENSSYVEGRLLDGFLLLAAGGSNTPDEVITVNLSSLQIVDIAEEDLSFFAQLYRVDLSDNQLGYEHLLEQIARIPRLGSLNLACNSISSLQVGHGILRCLEVLDLSFNGLHGDVLGQLARLPNLMWLNLASNCISSLPPEGELQGLQVLQELILDYNDLVQFMQWRSLDAVPQLRKLSLVSNRVKRLKDDAPDTASGTTISYFPYLEELDLSYNEITGVSSLPVINLFQSLRVLRLTENPCSRDSGNLSNVEVVCEDIKPFYMKGNGAFAKLEKIPKPKLKLDCRKMRKVSNMKQFGTFNSRPRSMSQLGFLDEETNALVVKLTGDILEMNARAISAPAAETGGMSQGILSDDLTEEELDQIFKDRKRTIEKRFEEPVEEPGSFMREPADAATKEKLLQLMRQMRQAEESVGGTQNQTPKGGLFLTGLEEASEQRPVRRPRPKRRPEPPEQDNLAPASAFQAFLASQGHTGPSQLDSPLPTPVGGVGLPDLRAVKKPVDAGVKEALRALRAAALSEFAVAHLNGFYSHLLDKGQALVSAVVEEIISDVSSCVVSLIIILLYVIFGLLHPLPIGGKVSNLVRSYLWKKTLVSLLYGFSVSALFLLLNNDLAIFFGIVSFFFNYVPEVGTIIAIIIPMPVILLDGRLASPATTLMKATMGQLAMKIVFNNIIETSLIQADTEMKVHPVWVLLTINYFGFIWGPVGMMIGVPILSVLKGAAVSTIELDTEKDDLTKAWAESFLACLEGRPQKAREKLEIAIGAMSLKARPEEEKLQNFGETTSAA